MKKQHLLSALLFTTLLSFQITAFASENPSEQEASKPLILAIDSQEATSHFARTDTYASQFESGGLIKASIKGKLDPISKTLKNVSRTFKRITSVRYGKSKKIRARLGATSLTLKYTYTL